jgi:hypothetical protein
VGNTLNYIKINASKCAEYFKLLKHFASKDLLSGLWEVMKQRSYLLDSRETGQVTTQCELSGLSHKEVSTSVLFCISKTFKLIQIDQKIK